MNWSSLSDLQLGKSGEYFAQMTFFLHGFEVFNTIVDERGIDFVATRNGKTYFVQAKAIRGTSSVCMAKTKVVIDKMHLVCYMKFTDGHIPNVYLFSTEEAFRLPKPPFFSHDYNQPTQTSKPEYCISGALKYASVFENNFRDDLVLPRL